MQSTGKNVSKLISVGALASLASFLLCYSRSFHDPVSRMYFLSASSIKKNCVARC